MSPIDSPKERVLTLPTYLNHLTHHQNIPLLSMDLSDYDYDVDSSTSLDILREEEFLDYRVNVWHKCDIPNSGSDSNFEDDRLNTYNPIFQIIIFIELTLVVIHFCYKRGGWRPRTFCLVWVFQVEIHIARTPLISSWELPGESCIHWSREQWCMDQSNGPLMLCNLHLLVPTRG